MKPPLRLPPLGGRWLVAYTILWLLVLPVAVAMPVYSAVTYFQQEQVPRWSPLGFWVEYEEQSIRIEAVNTREARNAGLTPGDTLVRIGGRPVPARAAPVTILPWLPMSEGAVVELVVRGSDGRLKTARLTRRAAHIEEAYAGSGLTNARIDAMWLICGLIPALVFIPAAMLLFRRRADSVAALLSLALLMLTGSEFVAASDWPKLGLASLGSALAATGWSALILVMLVFPSGRFEPRWSFWAVPPLALWWLACVAMTGDHTLEYVGYVPLFAVALAALTLRYRRLANGIERLQLRWVFFGFAAGALLFGVATALSALSEAFVPIDLRVAGWSLVLFYVFGSAGSACFALGLLVSLLRYRLYDADAVISRSAAYAVLTLTLAATVAASAKIIEVLFESWFGRDAGMLPGALGAGLAVMLITPLNQRLHNWAERWFQRALVHLRRDVPELVQDLRETAALEDLLNEILARIEAGSSTVRSALLIDDKVAAARGVPADEVGEANFPDSVPLRTVHDNSEIGLLLVGPRPDGSRLGKDEREALAEIADPVARAIRIVQRREARERRLEGRLAAIEGRLAEYRTE